MNKKAESFKKYLDDNKIKSFTVDEIADDQLNSVVFRSNIEINGQQLPTIVVLDSSIYGMVRVSLILDCCILFKDDSDGDLIYTMFDVIIRHLNGEYKKLMQLIWK